MLRCLRFLLACLLLAALPLKGYAAASMLLCQPGQAPGTLAVAVGQAEAGHAASHLQGHGDGHHGSGFHAPEGHLMKAAPGSAPSAAAHAPTGTDGHACGVCALCCHGLALSVTTHVAGAAPPPLAPVFAPPAHLSTRGLPVPDKPPRG